MKPLTLADLPELSEFARQRDALRDAVIAHKRVRRVAVGDRVSLVFEDRQTLRWQVLEMARVERIGSEAGLQQELDVYNELMPGNGELSATLFIEITDMAEIRPALDRLVGLHEHLSLVLGEGREEQRIPARFDEHQFDAERISAVHYVRFAVGRSQARMLADLTLPVRIAIDHPAYAASATLSGDTRASLLQDLA